MKKVKKEVQIALVAVVGVVVLFFGLQFLKGLSLFSNEEVYYVEFDDISGLAPSSNIYANGFKVGVVKQIDYDFERRGGCVATLSIDRRMLMTQGTTAAIESDMLGNVKVNLHFDPEQSQPIAPGDTIHGGLETGMLDKAAKMIPAVEQMLPKLDSIAMQLNALLADPALAGTLHNVEDITGNLTTTTAQLNTLMATLNRDMPGMMAKADAVLDNTDKITGNLSQVDFAATIAQVDETLANVKLMTDRLNSNEGSLGLLINDPGLYNNLTSTMRSADSLLTDLKARPKRYVHFSLFGKKAE